MTVFRIKLSDASDTSGPLRTTFPCKMGKNIFYLTWKWTQKHLALTKDLQTFLLNHQNHICKTGSVDKHLRKIVCYAEHFPKEQYIPAVLESEVRK